ncbi:MAG: ATP-binding protein [Bacteroidetes bacterium]|nr:ATP-binding protein [Bacteroidota bacterium]
MKNFMIFLLLLPMFARCGNFTGNNSHPPRQTLLAADSMRMPSGDIILDSLLQAAAIAPEDTGLAKLYHQIGKIYEHSDFEQAKAYYLESANLSKQLDWKKGYYLYAAGFTNILRDEGLTDSALVILQEAHDLAVQEHDESWTADITFKIGNAYASKEWYETALTYYLDALPLFEKKRDKEKLQTLYGNMAQLYRGIFATDQALEYAQKSMALNSDDPFAVIALATIYSDISQYEKAKLYYEEALRICNAQNNTFLLGVIYCHLGNDALMSFDLEQAESYAHLALEADMPFGRPACCADFIVLSKIEELKGRYGKSEEYAQEALQIALEYGALQEQRFCYLLMFEITAAQGRHRENIEYWEAFGSVENEIARNTTLRAAQEMEAKYETAKKDLEIERQQGVIVRQTLYRWLLASGVILCLMVLVLLWYMLRLRTRSNVALTEVNATKDKFFSIISHDLKNPITAQRDAIQLLVHNARLWDVDSLIDYCNKLLKSSEGNVALIYNLLGWAQLQTGRMIYNPATIILSAFLPDLSMIQKMAESKGVSFIVQMPADALVTGDANMLATVLRNLLGNAVKFTPKEGQITFRTELSAHGTCLFTVSDTGVGMSREQIRNLFRLEGVHSTCGTAGEQGSGLGLIVCRELLEKHGSTLHIESEEGKGSRFWFEISVT